LQAQSKNDGIVLSIAGKHRQHHYCIIIAATIPILLMMNSLVMMATINTGASSEGREGMGIAHIIK